MKVPDGFVLMPIEATPEMIAAALASTAYHHDFEAKLREDMSQLNVNREKMRVRYRAMVASVLLVSPTKEINKPPE